MNTQSYISNHFVGTQGGKLYYRSWIPAEFRALIVLIHGAGEHSGYYSDIGEECFHHQIALIAPDLRGFGKSEGHRGHVNRFQEYLDDLERLLTLLQERYPVLPFFLLGHSLGGLIAIRYGQEFPGKAKGVILSSPALGTRFRVPYPLKKFADLLSWMTPGFPIKPFKWSWLSSTLLQEPSDISNDPLFTVQYTPRWFTEFLQSGAHALSQAAKYRLPTLCLCGQQDPLIDTSLVQTFFDAIPIDDKEYVMFSEGRHRPLHEPRRDQAVDNIFRWVSSRI